MAGSEVGSSGSSSLSLRDPGAAIPAGVFLCACVCVCESNSIMGNHTPALLIPWGARRQLLVLCLLEES